MLEINPRHALVENLREADGGEPAVPADAAHLLFDEARIADGELPIDPRAFSARLMRLPERGTGWPIGLAPLALPVSGLTKLC